LTDVKSLDLRDCFEVKDPMLPRAAGSILPRLCLISAKLVVVFGWYESKSAKIMGFTSI
jgi:hypothetical protein